ncbi:MAG: YqeG family HAD IIIA-type phosphatase [Epulopiscium sp.]|nr:YqeG family HAD IIIA-type phosphatase [Candidatus Epulonipiscium sp.]
MLKRFFPDLYVSSIYEIPYHQLKDTKIKGLIFDIDNTLVPFDVTVGDAKLVDHFQFLTDIGFQICLVSNNSKERVRVFNKNLGVHAIYKAKKPLAKSFKKAMKMMNTIPSQTAIIGDQVFTDVWGGNRIGITTILVQPVVNRDEWITRIKRGLEQKVINIYLKQKKEIKK